MEKKGGIQFERKEIGCEVFLTKVCRDGFLRMQTYMDITRISAV